MQNPFETFDDRLSNIESLLLDLKHKTPEPSQPEAPEFLNTDEASKFIKLAKQTLYGLVHQQKVPYYKKGKILIFKRAELIEWVEQGRNKTAVEIDAEADQFLAKKRKGVMDV